MLRIKPGSEVSGPRNSELLPISDKYGKHNNELKLDKINNTIIKIQKYGDIFTLPFTKGQIYADKRYNQMKYKKQLTLCVFCNEKQKLVYTDKKYIILNIVEGKLEDFPDIFTHIATVQCIC